MSQLVKSVIGQTSQRKTTQTTGLVTILGTKYANPTCLSIINTASYFLSPFVRKSWSKRHSIKSYDRQHSLITSYWIGKKKKEENLKDRMVLKRSHFARTLFSHCSNGSSSSSSKSSIEEATTEEAAFKVEE
ncbi:hypothetical protein M0802_006272 [Mischocyttarus mexicanus]|nr:hypothetical protein M0802_006272 [Mischocyttarus mexicanus]